MEHWNRCYECGRFISLKDFESGHAIRWLETPDTEFTSEEFLALCPKHKLRGFRAHNLVIDDPVYYKKRK